MKHEDKMKPINKHLTAAFRLAHRASESEQYDLAARNAFREIAHEIWQAHGRPADESAAEESSNG